MLQITELPIVNFVETQSLSPIQKAELQYIGAVIPNEFTGQPFDGTPSPSANQVLETLKAELYERIELEKRPIAFKMSGGMDSRLLAFLLKDIWDSGKIEVHLVCHPNLGPQKDIDVVLAQRVLKFLGFSGEVSIFEGYPGSYLEDFKDGVVQLTGIYGTEILGGMMFDVLPVVERLKYQSVTDYLKKIPTEYSDHIETLINKYVLTGDTSFYIKTFLYSPETTFYGSPAAGWRFPKIFQDYYLAPFGFPKFTKEIMTLKKLDLVNYSFYDQIFKLLPEKYREIPLCSSYTDFNHHPFPPSSCLLNAKHLT